jgi:hopanoid biosynthesis associated protein HpnK
MRRLIINADDFGLTAGVNRGIMEAHEHGVVTSATLMASGPEFDGAVRLAQSAPALSVGCHAVLIDGLPLLDGAQIPSLVVGKSETQIRFRERWSSFAVAALGGRLVGEQIEAETRAQIRKLQSAGIAVDHLDTHKHTHIFPQVLGPLLRAAKACGVSAIRNPFEAMRLVQLAKRPSLCQRWAGNRALGGFATGFRRMVKAAGMLTPDGSVGIIATGSLDSGLLAGIAEALPEGTWELVCHPGYADGQLQKIQTRLRESRARELQLLTSADARELLAKHSIELISYRDLT